MIGAQVGYIGGEGMREGGICTADYTKFHKAAGGVIRQRPHLLF